MIESRGMDSEPTTIQEMWHLFQEHGRRFVRRSDQSPMMADQDKRTRFGTSNQIPEGDVGDVPIVIDVLFDIFCPTNMNVLPAFRRAQESNVNYVRLDVFSFHLRRVLAAERALPLLLLLRYPIRGIRGPSAKGGHTALQA